MIIKKESIDYIVPTIRVKTAYEWSRKQEALTGKSSWIIPIVLELPEHITTDDAELLVYHIQEKYHVLHYYFDELDNQIVLKKGAFTHLFVLETSEEKISINIQNSLSEYIDNKETIHKTSLFKPIFYRSKSKRILLLIIEHLISDLYACEIMIEYIRSLLGSKAIQHFKSLDYVDYCKDIDFLTIERKEIETKKFWSSFFSQPVSRNNWWYKNYPQPPYKLGILNKVILKESHVAKITDVIGLGDVGFFCYLLGCFVSVLRTKNLVKFLDVETYIHGRNKDNLNVFGLFMNAIIIRFDNPKIINPTVLSDIALKQLLKSFCHADYGYHSIRKMADNEVQPENFHWPLMFSYQISNSDLPSNLSNLENMKVVTNEYIKENGKAIKSAIEVTLNKIEHRVIVNFSFDYRVGKHLNINGFIEDWLKLID